MTVTIQDRDFLGNIIGEKQITGEVIGDNECFDVNEFYQYVIADGVVYKCYFDDKDEDGNEIDIDCIDCDVAYRYEITDFDPDEIRSWFEK